MKERPILFSGPMIRAILDGRKTMTRRVVKFPRSWPTYITHDDLEQSGFWLSESGWQYGDNLLPNQYEAGDLLWVRETWQQVIENRDGERFTAGFPYQGHTNSRIIYAATLNEEEPPRWRPSIFMPRWASRINLEATAVRFERLQEITDEDVRAEGCCDMQSDDGLSGWGAWPEPPPPWSGYTFRNTYRHLWDSINSKRGYGWDTNPWVRVISFERLKP